MIVPASPDAYQLAAETLLRGVEQLTEELTRQIYELNLEMAPSKLSVRRTKSRHEGEEGSNKKKGLFKVGKFKTKDPKPLPRATVDDDDRDDNDEEYNASPPRQNKELAPKKKKTLLRALGLRKSKGKHRTPAEIASSKQPQPLARTIGDMVSPRATNKACDFDEEEDYDTFEEEPEMSESRFSSSESQSQMKTTQRLPSATSSQTTQLTSNKVYIGVDGDAIEAMSVSSKNALSVSSKSSEILPVLSKDSSCESRDRYTTYSGEDIVTSGSKKVTVAKRPDPKKASVVDEPSIYEFLEVQYHPNDDIEAPLDEIEADAHRSR